MQPEASSSFTSPLVPARLTSLVWSCLDADLHRSAVFYAERYYALYPSSHDARHLYATALLRSNQPHTAHHLVNLPGEPRCTGCLDIKAKCCTALGRHRQAREALETCLKDTNYTPTPSMGNRSAYNFSEEAVLQCRAGTTAFKGNLPEDASGSFRRALALNPMLWEAFEGLCTLGNVPEVGEVFPPRARPSTGSSAADEFKQIPVATGAGFFTPDAGTNGNLFWKPDHAQQQPLHRMAAGPRESISTVDSSFYAEDSFQYKVPMVPSRSQPGPSLAVLPPAVRPLSSADEMGPVAKKLRSTVRQRVLPSSTAADKNLKPSKSAGALLQGADDRSKSSKNAATSSRSTVTKSAKEQAPAPSLARRSSRLLYGSTSKQKVAPKITAKDRQRIPARTLSHSDSDMDEDHPTSSTPHLPSTSPRGSPAPSGRSVGGEQAAQEAYEIQLADHIIYELVRMCAGATRALALYDCRGCLEELEKLPPPHQRSAWVMAMVGKAHYELGEYAAAERAFEAVRNLEPYRLWDMEVYSTLLWHLQRNVKLSFLAQELLAVDPQSPQAWIAVGNCFSLQKERAQALTCFHRALQLDPTCAYAYTLSGHESIDEDLDKAIGFFESALRADPRHYNAWYGLGTCYMRMSKLRSAEYHYRKAAEIHPQNAVLLGCVGMVNERYGKLDVALALYNEAVRLSQENALVRYHRAKVLIAMKKYKLAVQDLEALRDTSPDESNVIFQLARVYRLMGDKVKSAQTLAVARDVSPRSLHKIRKLVETAKDEEGDDDMDEG